MKNLHKIQRDLPLWVKEVVELWAPWQVNYPLIYEISTQDLYWIMFNGEKGRQNWTTGWIEQMKINSRDRDSATWSEQKFSYDLVTIID